MNTTNAKRHRLICKAALLAGVALAAWPALAAEVTPDRLPIPTGSRRTG